MRAREPLASSAQSRDRASAGALFAGGESAVVLSNDTEISYALACLKTGMVLASLRDAVRGVHAHDLTLRSLRPSTDEAPNDLGEVLQRVGSDIHRDSFQELVFVSVSMVHVVQRLPRRPDIAVVALCADRQKLGLMLFGVRALLLEFESGQLHVGS